MRDKIRNVLEILLAIAFIQGGVRILLEMPVVIEHPLSYLTTPIAIVTYGLMWLVIGISLLNAKFFKLIRLHKHTLLAMWTTCGYVMFLDMIITGLHWGQLLTISVAAASGWCWLEWKLKTEYVSVDTLDKDSKQL